MGSAHLKTELCRKLPELVAAAHASPIPVWRPISTREMAKFLGTNVQTLANWRVRDQGPRYAFAKRGKGNKCVYRLSDVLEWLSGRPSWEFDGEWLAYRGLGPEELDLDYIEWAKSGLP